MKKIFIALALAVSVTLVSTMLPSAVHADTASDAQKACQKKYSAKADISSCEYGYKGYFSGGGSRGSSADVICSGHTHESACRKGQSLASQAAQKNDNNNSDPSSGIPAGCPGSTATGPPAPGVKCPSAGDINCGVTVCTDPAANPKAKCDHSICDLVKKYVNPTINLLSLVVGLLAIISLIIGAIQYSSSEGDPQKSGKAKSRISTTIVALLAYFFLYAFLQFIVPGGIFNG